MLLSQELVLPCGLRLPNRLCKAAMAEDLSPSHNPDHTFVNAYTDWADGGWGIILTGNVMISDTYLGSPADIAVFSDPSAAVKESWKNFAATCQRNGTPAIVQVNHPGRQSPVLAGNRGFFAKNVAPSAVKLNFGPSFIEQFAVSLVFGTPRELTGEEIAGKGGIIELFVAAAKLSYDSGFKGVQLHGAHGYLLSQFLSPRTNLRTDEFGGSPAKRAEVVLRIIHAVREATSKEFCLGIKLNSVDAATSESLSDVLEQIKLIADAGIDFIEISGGTYENTRMITDNDTLPGNAGTAAKRTAERESFFLQFAIEVRKTFPDLVLMVTGGFRSRLGMEGALASGGCDIIGVGRPAAVLPKLPKEIILDTKGVPDEEAHVALGPVKVPFLKQLVPVKLVGAGHQTQYYSRQIGRMSKGLKPADTRLAVSD